MTSKNATWIKPIAKFGLAAKGTVYSLIGLMAFMAAFNIADQSSQKANKAGLFNEILDQPAGKIILIVVALGVFSYSIWRFIQAFLDTENKGNKLKGLAKRFTYSFSGLTYLAFSLLAAKRVLGQKESGGSNSKGFAEDILNQPAGQWLLGLVALVLAGIGVYQIWYGFSEKYCKHVDEQELDEKASHSLLRAGKIGYIARGIVWLVIAFMSLKAALHSNSSEAGDTSSAFVFVENSAYGNYLLAALGLGLICYGVMNFIRAGFEKFNT